MSGLVAVFNRNRAPVAEDDLQGMLAQMHARGPDRQSTWRDGAVGVGHCLLITTPESVHEEQPYRDEASGVVITSDARIDNRGELVARFKTGTDVPDSLLILQAYLEWGDHCVDHLLGDFAVVIYDPRRQVLVCFRDHFGVKSLYYFLSGSLFVIASDIRAVLSHPDVPKTINEGRIADYFVTRLEGINKTDTFYRDIYRLPPAHCMQVGPGQAECYQYWCLEPGETLYCKNEQDYVDGFEEKLDEAIRARLRSHGRPALTLSGGIDSSTIAALAMRQQHGGEKPLQMIAGISEKADCTESRFIHLVNQHLQGDLQTLKLENFSALDAELSCHFDQLVEPYDHMTLILLLYTLAAKNGQRVVLDGIDGDMVHSLSRNYPAILLRRLQVSRFVREINGLWLNSYSGKVSRAALFFRHLRGALVPDYLRHLRYRYAGNWLVNHAMRGTIIHPDFARRVDLHSRLLEFHTQQKQNPDNSIGQLHASTLNHSYLPVALERYDRVAALCSVEHRHPLLDKRLMEYSLRLPWQQKVRDGWSKYTLRKTAERYLPAELAWRRDWSHLGWSFNSAWMRNHFGAIQQKIAERRPHIEPFINMPYLEKILNEYSRMQNCPDEGLIWDVYQFATWYGRQ